MFLNCMWQVNGNWQANALVITLKPSYTLAYQMKEVVCSRVWEVELNVIVADSS